MAVDISDFLVIVPTYRRPDLLAEALRSALRQTGVSKRILVVDDCPDGSARAVVAAADPSIVYLQTPLPSGGWPGKVRNYGIESSVALGIAARYVHFLDDDDTVPDGHYRRAVQAFEANPDAGVVFGTLKAFCALSEDPERRQRQKQQLLQKQQELSYAAHVAWLYHHIGATLKLPRLRKWLYFSHALLGGSFFLCSGAVIRHQHVIALGGFDPEIRITEDYEFYTRAIMAHGVHFMQRISAHYRVGNADSLWNPLDLDAQATLDHQAEAQRFLTMRYRRLNAEFGRLRFRFRKLTFACASWIIESLALPLLDRVGVTPFGIRRMSRSRSVTIPTPSS
jgi:glycosyltransferase involved in cell wall biosynthesis